MAFNTTAPHGPTLFYGGTLSGSGKLSTRPSRRTFKDLSSIEKLVRLDIGIANTGAAIPNQDLARVFNRSFRTIAKWRNTAEYLRLRMEIMTGVMVNTGDQALDMVQYRREMFKEMLPTALRIIVDNMTRAPQNIQERKLQADIVRDFLDREGTYPKISRTDVHAKITPDFGAVDARANELLSMLDGPIQGEALNTGTSKIIEANNAFSNSETLAHDKQEEALASLEALPPLSGVIN